MSELYGPEPEMTPSFNEVVGKNIIISINGNIGSGKSRLLQQLIRKYKGRDDICFLDEPVEEWKNLKDDNGMDLIENYYKDQKKYAFPFQINAFVSRFSKIKEAVNKNKYKFIITERCIQTDKHVFAKMLYDIKLMSKLEYEIYLSLFKDFTEILDNTVFIYMKTEPNICYDRVKLRNRGGEEDIPLDYLESCHKYHEEWILDDVHRHKLVINGNIDVRKDPTIDDTWTKTFDSFINYYNYNVIDEHSMNVLYV